MRTSLTHSHTFSFAVLPLSFVCCFDEEEMKAIPGSTAGVVALLLATMAISAVVGVVEIQIEDGVLPGLPGANPDPSEVRVQCVSETLGDLKGITNLTSGQIYTLTFNIDYNHPPSWTCNFVWKTHTAHFLLWQNSYIVGVITDPIICDTCIWKVMPSGFWWKDTTLGKPYTFYRGWDD